MIPTFLINLDRDQERLAHMDKELRRLGIPYQRFSAIYGKEIDYQALIDADKSLRTEGRALTPGDVGTAASHRGVYEMVIDNNLDYALILEDDVALPKDFKTIVEREVVKNKMSHNAGWEYLAFDYGPMDHTLFAIWFRSYRVLLRRATFLGKVKTICYGLLKFFYVFPMFVFEIIRNRLRRNRPGAVNFYRPMYNAGAYIVTKGGAEKLKNIATPIYCTSDRLHNQARVKVGLKVRWYSPSIVRQIREEFGSTASEQNARDYQTGKAYVK